MQKRVLMAADCNSDAKREEFLSRLPRSMNGEGLTILPTERAKGETIRVSDGQRDAIYRPYEGRVDISKPLRVVEGRYTEAGWFMEAAFVRVTDGERTAAYVPYSVMVEEPA